MFTDIRGFTALSEKLDRKLLIELLNIYFERMTEIVFEFGGTIDKFIGDAMMVFFGAPDPMPLPEQSIRAVRMALRMMSALDELQATSPALRRNPVAIGIGINSGHVTIGNIGSEGRMDYTVMGTPVNLAARLEQTAGPRQILVSTPTLSYIEGLVECEDLGLRLFKNISEPVQVFNITGVRDTATDQPVPGPAAV
jgi:class 3 adenylate cyclase